MARGIEELAEMQVTGPVQGGDMVMKPDQAPVGAAALLNKMSRQNTPGIFKLPMPDKEMPNFMKVAAEGVEQQTAKGDSINQMAGELMRQGVDTRGMGMDEIIQIYEQTFGSPGDVDQFGVSKVDPSDWRTIMKMLDAGMSWDEIEEQYAAAKFPGNFTEEKQNVVELPKNLKTGPDNPETQLAYITPDEQALLAFMNPGTPHVGPEGVPTYDEGDYLDYRPSGMAGTGYRGPSRAQMSGSEGAGPGTGAIQEAMLEAALAGDTSQTYGGAAQEAGYDFAQPAAVEKQKAEIQKQGNINQAIKSLDISERNLLNAINRGDKKQAQRFIDSGVILPASFLAVQGAVPKESRDIFKDLTSRETDDEKKKETKEQGDFKKFLASIGDTSKLGLGMALNPSMMLAGAAAKMAEDFKVTPEKLQDQNYLAIMKDQLSPNELKKFLKDHSGVIADAYGPEEVGGADAFQAALAGAVAPVGSESQKRTDAEAYYTKPERDPEGKFFQPVSSRFANTIGNLENIAGIDANTQIFNSKTGKMEDKYSKDFQNKIFNAREEVHRQKYDQGIGARPGDKRSIYAGRPGEERITEEEEVVTTTDPRAGKFNVGGTMPYTEDIRTAGVETDVPLGRRFQIDKEGKYRGSTGMDLSKAMEYATLGGYGQLEPFQEYLARRRKHLGEDKPQYFDEEGNVIYSEAT